MKICSSCRYSKGISEFHNNQNYCKSCAIIKRRVYVKNNKEVINKANRNYRINNRLKIREKAKLYTKQNPDRIRDGILRRQYGISLSEYKLMLDAQNGNCGICGINQKDYTRTLVVDHSHVSKKIRGILCDRCNVLLGMSKDSVEILNRAIKYLEVSWGVK